jgi:hypothetical protein
VFDGGLDAFFVVLYNTNTKSEGGPMDKTNIVTTTEMSPVTTEKISVTTEKFPVNTEKVSENTEKTSVNTEKSSVTTETALPPAKNSTITGAIRAMGKKT